MSQLRPKFGGPCEGTSGFALAVEHADLGHDLALGGGDARRPPSIVGHEGGVDRGCAATPNGVSTSVFERTTTSIEA